MNKAKIHTVYKKADETRVPGVTTILGELSKPALIHWAWDLGTKGLDYRTFRDELADIGSLAHKMILTDLKNEMLVMDDFTRNQIDLAENCFLSYLEWKRQHKIEPLLVEQPLISETYGFGGTLDFYGTIDGTLTLQDFKTGKGIYDDFWYQIAGYWQLLLENSKPVNDFRILRIGRDETEGFEEKMKQGLELELRIFMAALDIYKVKHEIKRKSK